MTVSGDPDRLEAFTTLSLQSIDNAQPTVDQYAAAIRALQAAPTTVSFSVTSREIYLTGELGDLQRVDRRPAAFAFALRQLDHFVPETPRDRTWSYTADDELFAALVAARLAQPGASDADVYAAALDAVTGTPAQLASEVTDLLAAIDRAMDPDGVRDLQFQLQVLIGQIRDGDAWSGQPPLTDEQVAERAFLYLHAQIGDDGLVPADLVAQLEAVTARLARRRFDPAFTTAFYDALGPNATAALPRAAALAAWSDTIRNDGRPAFSLDNALVGIDSALASASPQLDDAFRETLFAHAADGHDLDDSFPLLFRYGQYAAPFAEQAGQVGIDVLRGELVVHRGVGSPGYDHFDILQTDWEARGAMLLDAAARIPAAATALLENEQNARWLTSDDLGHDDHSPRWSVIDQSVRDLIVSGTVANAPADPLGARLAATNVITGALAEGPGDAADALAPAYGAMSVQYLPDFALSPGFGTDLPPVVHDGHISLGGYQGSQFLSLAMHDGPSRDAIFRLRDILDLHVATEGMAGRLDPNLPDWIQQVANINGMVVSGANGEHVLTAAQLDEAATAYNENVDFWVSLGMSVVELKVPIPGPAGVIVDRGLDELKDDYLYHDTGHLDRTDNENSVATFNALDHERLVVAQAQLIVAVRAEVDGNALTAEQVQAIAAAEHKLGLPYVDALRATARGESVPTPTVAARDLQEWAGTAPTTNGSLAVMDYTRQVMPYDPRGLW